MKIIMLLSNPFKPDPRVYKEAKTLVKHGHEVTVLAWDRECGLPKTEVINGIKVRRIRQKAPYGKFLSLVPLMFMFWFRCLAFLLKEKFSIVHCHDFDTVIPGLIVAKIKRRQVIYDVHDYYPYMIVRRVPNFVVQTLDKFEGLVLKRVDGVITTDDKRGHLLLKKRAKKVTCVMNCVDLNKYRSPIKVGPSAYLKIVYIGALLQDRGIEHVIEAVSSLEGVTLTIAGFGADKEFLVERIPKESKNIRFIGEVHPSEVPNILSQHDLTFALYDPSILNNRFASPNKLFEAMAIGMPIIANDVGVLGSILKEEECGLIMRYGDIDGLRDAIIKLKNDVKLRVKLGKNGRRAVEQKYNWEMASEKLIGAYRDSSVPAYHS